MKVVAVADLPFAAKKLTQGIRWTHTGRFRSEYLDKNKKG